MLIERYFTTDKSSNVFDSVNFVKKAVILQNAKGETIFEQRDVMVPDFWSETSTTILATKYFRGTVGTIERENSLVQVVDRITSAIANTFIEKKYGSTEDARVLKDELSYLLVHQMMAFNSPVFFNVGVENVSQQVSACFILDVKDEMDSILNWYVEEGKIFKGGSGAGVNLSKIRSSKELLNGGGTASGPVSFMRGADASAGTIKSGGKTRRAAKMVVLDADHPDIEEFIWCKALEEKKIHSLQDAGFDVGFDGKDLSSIQYQNANNSVRISDDFMFALLNDEDWNMTARTDGRVIKKVKAKDLWRQIARAAWECADPGLQFDTTINDWNTTPQHGRIDASNPCSEHMRLANSSCNLASINLLQFYEPGEDFFNLDAYTAACGLTFLAQNILIDHADFPTEKIAQTTHRYRDLGLGYANLGALLMSMGLSYDSEEGRSVAAGLTSLLTATGYSMSSAIAKIHGPYEAYEKEATQTVLSKHMHAALTLKKEEARSDFIADLHATAVNMWELSRELISKHGTRNAQISVLAPTGTIGLLMGCDTTGIEPAFDLITYKKLVGGGTIAANIESVETALRVLGISSVDQRPDVFQTAAGKYPLSPESHVKMMGAVQPFLSGAISKTVNLPNSATVEDIEDIHLLAWNLGVKSIAVYRDGCKAFQPLSSEKEKKVETPTAHPKTTREKMPRQRKGHTNAFKVADLQGYVTTGEYEDGKLGEVFIKVSKQGSTLAGIVDAWSIAVSLGLQHGVPLESFVEKYSGMRFEPLGMTNDPDIRIANSFVDYIFRRLAVDYLDVESRNSYMIYTRDERVELLEEENKVEEKKDGATAKHISSPLCFQCGSFMRPSGACHVCESCGTTSGCS